MKFLAMIYSAPDGFESLSEKDRDALMTEADAFIKEFTDTGEFLGGSALADPGTGKTVRVRSGATTIFSSMSRLSGSHVLSRKVNKSRVCPLGSTIPRSMSVARSISMCRWFMRRTGRARQ